ncbi:hypothetical protein GGQ80_002731 [Sphingomonas jinjuensis]|uniref:Glycosyltransferase RgtA/B/C/D-like domain-containing protein n=1 Tax=Sphingomonas jinjuensis TaxID=535907 RepID=A0A840FNE3_9SPHN|nr:hypothetical protein [Sphingomonas jinjuensis]
MPLRRFRIVLFALVWFSAAWFGSWEFNPNNAVRLWAAVSLVESGDATIDEYAHMTVDKAQFGDHFYSDKAPGMTIAALPAAWVADRVTGERAGPLDKWLGNDLLARFTRLRLRLAAASISAVLTAIAAVLLFDLGLAVTGSVGAGLIAALGYALGTPIWGWSTTILGHAPVAALYVIALWAVWRMGEARAMRHAVVAGLALGAAVVVEHQAVIAGSAIGIWALARGAGRRNRRTLLAAFLIAGLVALLPLAIYNIVAFGTPFRVSYSGVVGWQGMQQGLFGLTWPRPMVLWQILFGTKVGLVWVAPILLLAAPGLAMLTERRDTRGLAITAATVAAASLLVNAAYVYWEGGNTTGPRIAMPLAGALALGLAPWWAAFRGAAVRGLTLGVLTVSIAINAMVAAAEIFGPQGWDWQLWRGVIQPHFLNGELRTAPSEWFGWTPWHGFALWAAVATVMLAWLVWAAGRAYPDAARVTGASVDDHGEARA